MGVETAIMAGGSVLGNIIQGNVQKDAARRAGRAEQNRLDQAIAEQKAAKEEATKLYDPFAKAGSDSLDMYMKGLTGGSATIENSPIYQEKKAQLERDTAAALAATGKSRSGVGVTNYTQPGLLKLYDTESNNYFNRLTPMINTGYSATQGQANAAMGTGNNVANLYSNMGTSEANQYQAEANAQNSGIMGSINSINKTFGDARNAELWKQYAASRTAAPSQGLYGPGM